MKPSEILERAAAHMDRVGHHQKWYWASWAPRDEAPCCAMGAIMRVASTVDETSLAFAVLARIIGGRIDAFNDAPGRTKDEVVAKLRISAAIARAEGK